MSLTPPIPFPSILSIFIIFRRRRHEISLPPFQILSPQAQSIFLYARVTTITCEPRYRIFFSFISTETNEKLTYTLTHHTHTPPLAHIRLYYAYFCDVHCIAAAVWPPTGIGVSWKRSQTAYCNIILCCYYYYYNKRVKLYIILYRHPARFALPQAHFPHAFNYRIIVCVIIL